MGLASSNARRAHPSAHRRWKAGGTSGATGTSTVDAEPAVGERRSRSRAGTRAGARRRPGSRRGNGTGAAARPTNRTRSRGNVRGRVATSSAVRQPGTPGQEGRSRQREIRRGAEATRSVRARPERQPRRASAGTRSRRGCRPPACPWPTGRGRRGARRSAARPSALRAEGDRPLERGLDGDRSSRRRRGASARRAAARRDRGGAGRPRRRP